MSQPDETPLEILRDAEHRELRYEVGGEPDRLELLEPLPGEAIESLAARMPCPLPPPTRELLEHTRGLASGPLEIVEFGGLGEFEYPELFPHPIDLAADGFGNYWVVDLTPDSTGWGPIYFACHDPPVIIYQAPDLSTFLREMLKLGDPEGPRSELDAVHEDYSMRVWTKNPGMMPVEACLQGGDPVLERFAASLPPGSMIRDLRDAAPGDGFSWGRFGPRTEVSRAGAAPIFGWAPRTRLRRVLDWLGWRG